MLGFIVKITQFRQQTIRGLKMLVLGLICLLSFAAAAPAPQEAEIQDSFLGNAAAPEEVAAPEVLAAAEPYYSTIPEIPQPEPQPASGEYGSDFQPAPKPQLIASLPEQESIDLNEPQPQPAPANKEYGSSFQPATIPEPISPPTEQDPIDLIVLEPQPQPANEEYGSIFQTLSIPQHISVPEIPEPEPQPQPEPANEEFGNIFQPSLIPQPIPSPPELQPIYPVSIDDSILAYHPEVPGGNFEGEQNNPGEEKPGKENKDEEQKPVEQQKPPVVILDVNQPSFLANLFSNFSWPPTFSWPSLNFPSFNFSNLFGGRAVGYPAYYQYPSYRYIVQSETKAADQPDQSRFF